MAKNVEHRAPTYQHWEELERFEQRVRKGKEYEDGKKVKPHKAELKRLNALEWLRYESLRVGAAAKELTPSEGEFYRAQIAFAQAKRHYYLIGYGPKPKTSIAINVLPPYARKLLSIIFLEPGKLPLPGYTVFTVAADLSHRTEDLAEMFGKALTKHKNSRAQGAGRFKSLARMAEALRMYAQHRESPTEWTTQKIGEESPSCPPVSAKDRDEGTMKAFDIYQDHGQKLIDLAREMICAAKSGAWWQTYPAR